jgi:hypothetical protein
MVSTREGNPHRKNFRYCWFDVWKIHEIFEKNSSYFYHDTTNLCD